MALTSTPTQGRRGARGAARGPACPLERRPRRAAAGRGRTGGRGGGAGQRAGGVLAADAGGCEGGRVTFAGPLHIYDRLRVTVYFRVHGL
jgi:hypothetical protein